MAVVKWDPYRDVWTLQDRVNRLFQEGMSEIGRASCRERV